MKAISTIRLTQQLFCFLFDNMFFLLLPHFGIEIECLPLSSVLFTSELPRESPCWSCLSNMYYSNFIFAIVLSTFDACRCILETQALTKVRLGRGFKSRNKELSMRRRISLLFSILFLRRLRSHIVHDCCESIVKLFYPFVGSHL